MQTQTLAELDTEIAGLVAEVNRLMGRLDEASGWLREARAKRKLLLDRIEDEVMGRTKPRLAKALAEDRRSRERKRA